MIKLGFVKKRVYSVFNSVNYRSTLSNLFSLIPSSQIISLYNVKEYERFELILVSFFKGSAYLHFSARMSSAYRE